MEGYIKEHVKGFDQWLVEDAAVSRPDNHNFIPQVADYGTPEVKPAKSLKPMDIKQGQGNPDALGYTDNEHSLQTGSVGKNPGMDGEPDLRGPKKNAHKTGGDLGTKGLPAEYVGPKDMRGPKESGN